MPPSIPGIDAARAVMLCAPFVGLGAFALIEWADWGTGADPRAAGGGAELGVWEMLVTASVIVWVALAAVGLRLLRDLDAGAARRADRWREAGFVLFVYAAIVVVLVAGGLAGLRNPFVLARQDWKIPLLHVLAGVAVTPMLVVCTRAQLHAAAGTWSTAAEDIERLRRLRSSTHAAVASLGAVIALAVIATGALRQATEAAGLTPLPGSFTLVYGAWFTGVVAAVYLHVFGALEARGRWLVQTAAPLPDPAPDSADRFAVRRGLRAELAQELELGGDPRRNLEALLAVLAPLAGGLLTSIGGL